LDIEPDFVTWYGSEDAADSTASNLERDYPCANCAWEPGGEAHDDDNCQWGYEADLPAEETGEFLITDWDYYQGYGYPFFARQAEESGDTEYMSQPIWVVAAHCIKDGAEEGELQPRCEPTTLAQCRKLAEQMDLGCLIGG
jgi:hypothetical protein